MELEPTKRAHVRFSVADDLKLLKAVKEYNPFVNRESWHDIVLELQSATDKPFLYRGCKDRLDHLSNLYVLNDVEKLKRSASEADYKEKHSLLEEISKLRGENPPKKAALVAKHARKDHSYLATPKLVMPKPNQTLQNQGPVWLAMNARVEALKESKRLDQENERLASENAEKLKLEAKKLELEERKLALEEERVRSQIEEAKMRMRVEEQRLRCDETRDKLLLALLEKVSK